MEEIRLYLRRILFMIQKELIATLKDKKSRLVLLMPVLVQTLAFGYVATYNLDKVQYVVLDQNRSRYSAELLSKIDGSPVFTRAATLETTQGMATWIDSGKVSAVLVIPPDFDRRILSGSAAPVQVITDGRNTMISGLVTAYISKIAATYNYELHGGKQSISIETVAWYNPNLDSRWGFLASLIPMVSLTQVLALAGLSVAREREQGTFDQLMVTPLTPSQIFIGKAVPPVLIGLAQSMIVLSISVWWFGVALAGSLFTLILTMIFFLMSIVGIGLATSAVSRDMQQVMVYNFFAIMPMILLSGMVTPIKNMPPALQIFTYINPMRFAIDSVRRIYLEGAGLSLISHNYIPLLLITAVAMPLAAWMFRHKLV